MGLRRVSIKWRAAIALALPVIYMLLIYRLSAMPGGSIQVSVSDKFLHTVEYGGLSFLLYFALHYGLGARPGRAAWLAVLMAALYGAGDELHQSLVPGRDMSILDWYADIAGALLAQGGLCLVRTRCMKKTLAPPHA